MTPTPPTERELLARDLADLSYTPKFGIPLDELMPEYLRIADHLIAAGYVQWDEAKERCAKAVCYLCQEGEPVGDHGLHAYTNAIGTKTLHHCPAQGIRALPLTPPKGTER